MRDRLDRFRQGDRSVLDYVHQLETLMLSAGVLTEQDRVERLWKGFRPSIQSGLFLHHLTPTSSAWDEIVTAAQFIEMAEKAASESRMSGGNHSGGNGDGNSSRKKPPSPSNRNGGPSTTSAGGAASSSKGGQSSRNQQSHQHRLKRERGQRPFGNKGSSSSGQVQIRPKNGNQGDNKLSEQEKARLAAEDRCYKCKEKGHFARNCPQGNQVKSDRKGQPPGLTNYNIEPSFESAEHLRDLAESTARIEEPGLEANAAGLWDDMPELQSVSDSEDDKDGSDADLSGNEESSGFLDIFATSFDNEDNPGAISDDETITEMVSEEGSTAVESSDDPDEEESPILPFMEDEEYPVISKARLPLYGSARVEDLYRRRANRLLRDNAPYCTGGCPRRNELVEDDLDAFSWTRLLGSSSQSDEYILHHEYVPPPLRGPFRVPTVEFRSPNFNPARWFAERVSAAHGDNHLRSELYDEPMGDVVSLEAIALLNEMIPWPTHVERHGVHHEPRFMLLERAEDDVVVLDRYLAIWLFVPVVLLTNPRFELGNWWIRQVSRILAEASQEDETNDYEGYNEEHEPGSGSASIGLNAVSTARPKGVDSLPALQRNAANPRDFKRLIPEPAVV
ncbi:hypothetical protein CERSUDRAFT_101067, partial [Gelatoporia subvermispora B]